VLPTFTQEWFAVCAYLVQAMVVHTLVAIG